MLRVIIFSGAVVDHRMVAKLRSNRYLDVMVAHSLFAAKALLGRRSFDVALVSLDSAIETLEVSRELRHELPETVVVARGKPDNTQLLETAHQVISETAPNDTIESRLVEMAPLRELLSVPAAKRIAMRLGRIPGLGGTASRIRAMMSDRDFAIRQAVDVLNADPGLAAEIFRQAEMLAFARQRPPEGLQEAVLLLGADAIAAIAASQAVGSLVDPSDPLAQVVVLESQLVAQLASEIAFNCKPSEAYAAGLLHDLGLMTLLAGGEGRATVEQLISHPELAGSGGETRLLGCTHAQIGGAVAGTWGLSGSMIEAIGWHHSPRRRSPSGAGLLATVHLAAALMEGTEPDLNWLGAAGLKPDMERWKARADELLPKLEAPPTAEDPEEAQSAADEEPERSPPDPAQVAAMRSVNSIVEHLALRLSQVDPDRFELLVEVTDDAYALSSTLTRNEDCMVPAALLAAIVDLSGGDDKSLTDLGNDLKRGQGTQTLGFAICNATMETPIGRRLDRALHAHRQFWSLRTLGLSRQEAAQELGAYEEDVQAVFRSCVPMMVPVAELCAGMVLADDVLGASGRRIARAGQKLTKASLGPLRRLATEDEVLVIPAATCQEVGSEQAE